jgi:hypothetical protein
MVMIDGDRSLNGREKPAIEASIRAALTRKPGFALSTELLLQEQRRTGELRVAIAPLSPRVKGRELLT